MSSLHPSSSIGCKICNNTRIKTHLITPWRFINILFTLIHREYLNLSLLYFRAAHFDQPYPTTRQLYSMLTFNGIFGESSAKPISSKTTTDVKLSKLFPSWKRTASSNALKIPSEVASGLHWKDTMWICTKHEVSEYETHCSHFSEYVTRIHYSALHMRLQIFIAPESSWKKWR